MSCWKEHKTIRGIEIEEEGNDQMLLLQAEVEVTMCRDMNYGADADGNRGMRQDFIDGWEIESIFDLDSGEDVTENFKDNLDVADQIEKQIGGN